MYKGYRIGAVLLMGGAGVRFGGVTPKQFTLLGAKVVYLHATETFLSLNLFDQIVLVCHPLWIKKIKITSPLLCLVKGGATRQESSFTGLKAFSCEPQIVAIHDTVRPFVTKEIILANLDAAILHGATNTCIPTTDTLVFSPDGEKIVSIPERKEFLRGQTPQTFRYPLIMEVHKQALKKGIHNASDDCQLVLDAGHPITIVKGCEKNLKITSKFDVTIAEGVLRTNPGGAF